MKILLNWKNCYLECILFIFRISSSIDITVKNSYIKTWEDLNWAYYSMKVDLCLFDSIKKKSSIV